MLYIGFHIPFVATVDRNLRPSTFIRSSGLCTPVAVGWMGFWHPVTGVASIEGLPCAKP